MLLVNREHVHAAGTAQLSCCTDKSKLHVAARTVSCPSLCVQKRLIVALLQYVWWCWPAGGAGCGAGVAPHGLPSQPAGAPCQAAGGAPSLAPSTPTSRTKGKRKLPSLSDGGQARVAEVLSSQLLCQSPQLLYQSPQLLYQSPQLLYESPQLLPLINPR